MLLRNDHQDFLVLVLETMTIKVLLVLLVTIALLEVLTLLHINVQLGLTVIELIYGVLINAQYVLLVNIVLQERSL